MSNIEQQTPAVREAPIKMIENFAKQYHLAPEKVREIFCAGVVAEKAAGTLAMDVTPTIHWDRVE